LPEDCVCAFGGLDELGVLGDWANAAVATAALSALDIKILLSIFSSSWSHATQRAANGHRSMLMEH
jgi:hypothetical protein